MAMSISTVLRSAAVIGAVAALSPSDLILRGLECRGSISRARSTPAELPAELAARLGNAPEIEFFAIVRASDAVGISSAQRKEAHESFRNAPRTNEEITPEYVAYIDECLAINDAVAQHMAATPAA